MPSLDVFRSWKVAACLAVAIVSLSVTADETASWEREPGCGYASPEDIGAKIASLSAARSARDPEAAAAHYSTDAIVMDVGETSIRLGQAEIVALYAASANGPAVESLTQTVEAACGLVTVTGTQRYRWTEPPSTAIVRYRLLFSRFHDRWLIIHHHADVLEHEQAKPTIVAKPVVVPSSPALKPSLATALLTTGSIEGARLPDIELPPAAFRLPAQPPVFFSQDRPELLSAPRANAPLPRATSAPIEVPALPINAPNASLPPALQGIAPQVVPPQVMAPQVMAPVASTVRIPELPFAVHSLSVTAALWRNSTASAAVASAPTVAIAVIVPPLPFSLGAFPVVPTTQRTEPAVASPKASAAAKATESAAPKNQSALTTPTPPMEAKRSDPPSRTPKVASFSKRADPAQASMPKTARKAARSAPLQTAETTPPAPAKYRAGRWVYDSPVFGD